MTPTSTRLIGTALRAALSPRIRRLSDLRRLGREAGLTQREQLRALLHTARNTEIGVHAGFDRLVRLPLHELPGAFARSLPVGDYEAFRARLARMREAGEPNVLWPGRVMDWAQTSGTTGAGGQKYIPVSRAMLASNRKAALDIFAHAARFGVSVPGLFAGKLLFLGGSTDLQTNQHGIRTGDLSGVVTRLITWPFSQFTLPTRDVALMSHWPTKIDAMAAQVVDADVRFVSGMASWSLILFERVVTLARERNPRVRTLRDVWPNFQLFVHGGVNYAPFDPRVREAWSGDPASDVPARLEVYPASEGFIAVQDTPGDPGLRLHTDIGLFFEFVPLDEIDAAAPRSFTCDRVEKGQRYVVVMTTCAGLWRYIIGDVVVFDTVGRDAPPRLRIVGRHRAFINAFGENLIVEDIETAVVEAARAAGVHVGEFTAAPVYPDQGRRPGIQLAVEWGGVSFEGPPPSGPPGPESLAEFSDLFDKALRNRNIDYDTKRTGDLGMAPAVVSPLPIGAFHRWMASRGKLGGQHKAPRCANNRQVIDEVLSCAGASTISRTLEPPVTA